MQKYARERQMETDSLESFHMSALVWRLEAAILAKVKSSLLQSELHTCTKTYL